MRVLVCVLVGTASVLLAVDSTFAATFTVTNLNDSGPGSLRDTIAAASNGDTIAFAVTGTISFASEIEFSKNLTISGPGASLLILQPTLGQATRLFHIQAGTSTISDLTINKGRRNGPGAGIYKNNGNLTLNGCVFSNNFPASAESDGGAVYNDFGTLTANGCTFTSNSAAGGQGGAIFNLRGTVNLYGCLLSSNSAQDGGALHCNGTFGENVAATVNNCVFLSNTATPGPPPATSGSGGAISAFGVNGNGVSLTVESCLFSNNRAFGSASDGGAIRAGGNSANASIVIRNSTFNDNRSDDAGGAFSFFSNNSLGGNPSVTASVLNCTMLRNVANHGGALFNQAAGTSTASIQVTSCTLSNNGNVAGNGNTIENAIINSAAANLTVRNTILQKASGAGGVNLVNIGGTLNSQGYNLSDDGGGGFLVGPFDQLNLDPKFDPLGLQDNGGPTPTIALLANSPALDRGNSFGVFTDQRGLLRPVDSPFVTNAADGTDIGAYEAGDALQTGEPNFNVTTLHDHDDGIAGILDCTLREAINRANAISGANTILFLVGGTITLDETLGPLTVTGPTTLAGFGARVMTISGGNSTPVFHFSGGPSFLSGFTIRDGRSSAFFPTPVGGAGLFNTGTLTVNVCTFVNNHAAAGAGGDPGEAGGLAQGGGVLNAVGGVLTFNRCTFSGNSANGGRGANSFSDFNPGGMGGAAQGGALFNDSGATLTVSLCTLAANSATGGAGGNNTGGNGFGGNGGVGEGAAIFNRGTLNVRASTVARNTGLGGMGGLGSVPVRNGANGTGSGGVTHDSGMATMRNSISALNSGIGGPDVAGAFTSEGYNFIGIGDTASGFTGPADQVGTTGSPFDPSLGPLQNNGGPTDTLALSLGPATDAGHSFGLTSDQRGQPRPSDFPLIPNAPGGDGTDIGAFESRAVLFVTTLDDHDDGTADEFDCSLREAINAANAEAGDQAIKFAPLLTGTIQLNSALPSLSTTIFLQGPGANVLTVRRNVGGDYRIFTIGNGTSDGPYVSIRGLTIANGKAPAGVFPANAGGGILVDHGVLQLQHCALTGNQSAIGGAILIHERYAGEPSLVENCTLNGNVAESSGGAVYNNAAGAVFENCTFSGNSSTFGNGGAVFGGASSGAYELVVRSCTFVGNNTGNLGGGIAVGGGGTAYLANSILKNNGPSNLHVFTGTFVSQGYNLSSDAGGGYLTATGDKVNTDPLLGPLASNGGPTQTHALLPGSPAINMGFPDLGPPGDQRGYPRIGRQDIGAFEFDSFALRIISITRLPDGHIKLIGKGVVNATFSIHASPDLSPNSFSGIASAASDMFGDWQFEDPDAVGLTKRFYRASFP